MLEMLVSGINYGLMALGFAVAFVVGGIIVSPIPVFVAVVISKLCGGSKNHELLSVHCRSRR